MGRGKAACKAGANSSSLRASAEPSSAWSIAAISSAREGETPVLTELTLPAALGLFGQRVEPRHDIGYRRGCFLRIGDDVGIEHAKYGSLLDHLPIITAVQPVKDVADLARLLDQLTQIGASALLAACQAQDRILQPGVDQVILERALILEILLGLAARDLVERRLRDEQIAALDQFRHLPVEEGQ